MRALRSIIAAIIFLFVIQLEVYCQAPVFSQYYSSGLYLNPALAGLEKNTYFGMNYRSQWNNLSLPFNTFQFSFIHPINRPGARKKHLGGFGLSYLNDVAGAQKEFVTQAISISAAHNLHLNRHGNNIIAFALQVGASQQRINYDKLQWSSQYSSVVGYDQTLPGESSLINYQILQPILNTGVMWYYTNKQLNLSYLSTSIYNGFSVSNVLQTNSFYVHGRGDASILYKVHGGFSTTWSRKVDFSPNYLIQIQDRNFQLNVGTYMGYSITNLRPTSKTGNTKVLIGGWYRLRDSFIISTGLSNAIWNIGFSYDNNIFTLSKAYGYGNAYEFSLAYKIHNKNGYKRLSSPLI